MTGRAGLFGDRDDCRPLEAGTTDRTWDRLKIEVNTRARCTAHDFSARLGMPSGLAAFLMFTRTVYRSHRC